MWKSNKDINHVLVGFVHILYWSFLLFSVAATASVAMINMSMIGKSKLKRNVQISATYVKSSSNK
jgi:hypothetical protein